MRDDETPAAPPAPGDRPDHARLLNIARAIQTPFRPHAALAVNQATLRVVKFRGRFPQWHTHDADECYVVLEGEMVVELEAGDAPRLGPGDAYVVRAGVDHRPRALPTATVLLVT